MSPTDPLVTAGAALSSALGGALPDAPLAPAAQTGAASPRPGVTLHLNLQAPDGPTALFRSEAQIAAALARAAALGGG
jgi:hypothetical protein